MKGVEKTKASLNHAGSFFVSYHGVLYVKREFEKVGKKTLFYKKGSTFITGCVYIENY